jgi:Tol biopolymer transport system component
MLAPNACCIRFANTEDDGALGRLAGRRGLWRVSVVALWVGLALAALASPAWAAKDDLDLVSRADGAAGANGNEHSSSPAISADGRLVAFYSEASNLHPDDGDGGMDGRDVFVRDVEANTTVLVSRASDVAGVAGAKGNGASEVPAISADGRFVAFSSGASNLHPDDGDGSYDVFVRDLEANTTTLVSRASGDAGAAGEKGNGGSYSPAISADGRFVAFVSDASNLHSDDTDGTDDVFVRDLVANTTTLVSRADGASGAKGNGYAMEPAISADGRVVAFISASNLDPDDSNGHQDAYVRDLDAYTTTLASRADGAAGAIAESGSLVPAISADGRVVAFASTAENLHAADTDGWQDVFVRDLEANTTRLASRADGATGADANNFSFEPAISADGRLVAFESEASNLHPDDGDRSYDVFVRDLEANTTALVSRPAGAAQSKGNSYSYEPTMSPDGRFVAFASAATNLHPDDGDFTLDVFRRDVLGLAPAAAADAYATSEDTPLTVDSPGVLANDSDPDGDALTAVVVAAPQHGRLELGGDGSFSYTPDPDYNGTDGFSYRASDGGLDSQPVTVTIDVGPVDDPPPPTGPASTPPANAAAAPGPTAAPTEPALAQLRLASRCVRPSRSGRVRIPMSLRMARPGPLQVRIDRAVGAGASRGCPSPNPRRRFTGRFHNVATLSQPATARAAAAMVTRRLTLRLRLAPGLYRITVRARLDHNRLSRPLRRFLRVLN